MPLDFSPLTDYLHRQIDLGVPGCELIVCRDHDVLYHECAGFSDAARTVPAAPTDRYFAYSCTKPLTVTCAMQCLERGLIGLDDPVEAYLPAFREVYLLRDGKRVRPQTVMALRHLFTMTAGLDYDLQAQPIRDAIAHTDGSTVAIVSALSRSPLHFEPGSRYRYSLCHDVLGAVVEVVSGMSLRETMRAHLFAPLGMTRSDFYIAGQPCDDLAVQVGYDAAAAAIVPYPATNDFALTPRYFSGGAGVVTCATDYARFADALACGTGANGVSILSQPSIDLMRGEQLRTFSASGVFTCTCGPDYGYGLGVRTRVACTEGVPSAPGEFGWDGAAGMDVLIDPAHHLSFVFAEHMRGWPALQGAIHLQIRDLLYPILSESL